MLKNAKKEQLKYISSNSNIVIYLANNLKYIYSY